MSEINNRNQMKQKRNNKKRRLKKLLIFVLILFFMLILAGTLLVQQRKNADRQQRKEEALAALESVPTVTPTPAATPTPTPTPIPTATPTPVLERAYVFDPDDYLGSWHSKNGRIVIEITKLSQKSVTFTYSQTNRKKTATCEAAMHQDFLLQIPWGMWQKVILLLITASCMSILKQRQKQKGRKYIRLQIPS